MTPDEIREFDGTGFNDTGVMFYMLRELTAQVAELKELLQYGDAAVQVRNQLTTYGPVPLLTGGS